MGKYTIGKVNEGAGENDDESATDIINITLVTAVIAFPSVGNNLLNDRKHTYLLQNDRIMEGTVQRKAKAMI
jgi:hypothetical protein